MLSKIVRKSMHKKRGLLIAISILIMISSLFVGLSEFVYTTMQEDVNKLYTKSNVEDFTLNTLPLNSDEYTEYYNQDLLTELEEKYDVVLQEREIATYQRDSEADCIYQVYQYNPDDQIDKFILTDGQMPEKANELALQVDALDYLDLRIGDEFSLDGITYQIVGSGYLVNEVMPISPANQVLRPNYEQYMPLILSESAYTELDFNNPNWTKQNLIIGQFKQNLSTNEKSEVLFNIAEETTVKIPVLDQNGQAQLSADNQVVTEDISLFPGTMSFDQNANISTPLKEIQANTATFKFLSSIMTIITIALSTILINSVFKAQGREMGILKAEGVSQSKLELGFVGYMTILIAFMSLLGALLSMQVAKQMRNLYSTMFIFEQNPASNQVLISVLTTTIIIIILTVIIIYFASIRRNLKTPVLRLVKNIDQEKPPKFNVNKYFKRLSFTRRYQINLIIRNWAKTLLLSFAVLISSFMLLMGVLMYTSLYNLTNNTYSEHFDYAYSVVYSQANIISENDVDYPYITNNLQINEFNSDTQLNQEVPSDAQVGIEAYDFDQNNLVNLTTIDDQPVTNDLDGVLATSGFMNEYELELGDKIKVTNPYDQSQTITLTINAVTNDYFAPRLYMSLDHYQNTFDLKSEVVNGFLSPDVLTNSKAKTISEQDSLAQITEVQDLESALADSMVMINVAIGMIAVFASIIAFITIYAISSVIIDSNQKTISIMKVLGYTNQEIRKMTIGVYKWFVIIIYILAIPSLKIMIQQTVDTAFKEMDFAITIDLNYMIALGGLLIIFSIYLISSNLSYRKITRVKLAESLNRDE